jgi:GNAT superfamily N-acetyltransferase
MTYIISNLRERPEFVSTIADRCWNAWWTDSPVSLREYTGWVQACVTSTGVPAAMVAHEDGVYAGSAKLIASDLEQRPHYTPWIAALWVDETFRRQGIAEALIQQARAEARRCGFDKVYLCATESNSPYYRARGFTQIETDVGGLNIFAIVT